MNAKRNPAGKSTHEMAYRRWRNALFIGLIVLVILIVLALFIFTAKAWWIGGAAFLGILIGARLLVDWFEGYDRRSRKAEKRAICGAKAEETIGAMLDALGPGFFVLHDIESPNGNIDHVVLGEHRGVFLIETKSHYGKVDVVEGGILVSGIPPEKNFIGQVLNNTYWLKERITQLTGMQPWITPILVFTNAFVPYLQPIKNIHVINKRYLISTISKIKKLEASNIRLWEQREKISEGLVKS